MSTIVISVGVSGLLDNEDRDAIMRAITLENVRRAAQVPPLPALPFATVVERRDSYEAILQPRLVGSMDSIHQHLPMVDLKSYVIH